MEDNIKNTILPEINYAFENTVSYSQYSTFLKCEYQWYLSYLKDLNPNKPSIYTIFGTSIHETIQHYLDLIYNNSPLEADDSEIFDIAEYFNERFRINYNIEFDKIKQHFSSAQEMREFFEDGVSILLFLQQNRKKYFQTKKFKLLGVEVPLLYKLNKNIYYKGFIDFVLYDEVEDRVTIFDIKTSTRGWSEGEKKDEIKISQVLLYKEYFAKQYKVDIDKIEVEYFIVKRKLYDNSKFPMSRIQSFSPSSGKIKRKKIMDGFENFLKECYDITGKPIDKQYKKIVGKKSCTYCPYNNTEHCDKKN